MEQLVKYVRVLWPTHQNGMGRRLGARSSPRGLLRAVDRQAPDHNVNVDLIIAAWGEGTTPKDRFLASLLYRPSADGGSFMVTNARSRLPAKQEVCGRAMERAEIVGTPLAQEVFALLDALWLSDPRLAEVRALNDVV